MLYDRHGDPDRVCLLKAVRADQLGANLPGQEDGRDGVHARVGDRRNQVRRAGSRGPECHADLAGCLGVALSGVAGALLVAAEDVPDARVVERVVGGQVGATGNPEYGRDPFGLQAFHHGVDRSHSSVPLSEKVLSASRSAL